MSWFGRVSDERVRDEDVPVLAENETRETTGEIQSAITLSEQSDELFQMGVRLDDNHVPETNGRIAVCRRCGMRTDVLHGAHLPSEPDLVKASNWLRQQAIEARAAQFKRVQNT